MRTKQDKNDRDQQVPCCYQSEDSQHFDISLDDGKCNETSDIIPSSKDPIKVQYRPFGSSDMESLNRGSSQSDMIRVATVKKSNTLARSHGASYVPPVVPVYPGHGKDDVETAGTKSRLTEAPLSTFSSGDNILDPKKNDSSSNQIKDKNRSLRDNNHGDQITPEEISHKEINPDGSKEKHNYNIYQDENFLGNPRASNTDRKTHRRVKSSPIQGKQYCPDMYGRAHWAQLSADRLRRNEGHRGGFGGGAGAPLTLKAGKGSNAPLIPPRVFLTEMTIEEDSEPSHEDEVLKANPGEITSHPEKESVTDKFESTKYERSNFDNKRIDRIRRSTWTGRLATPDNNPLNKEDKTINTNSGTNSQNEEAYRIFAPERMSTRLNTPDDSSRACRGSSYISNCNSYGSTSSCDSNTIYANTSDPGAPEPAYANIFETVGTESEDKDLNLGEPIYSTLGHIAENSGENHSSSSASTLCPDEQQKGNIQANEKLTKEKDTNSLKSGIPFSREPYGNINHINKPYHTMPRLSSEQRNSDLQTNSVPRDYGLKIRIVGRSQSHSESQMKNSKLSPKAVPLISSYSSSSSSSSSSYIPSSESCSSSLSSLCETTQEKKQDMSDKDMKNSNNGDNGSGAYYVIVGKTPGGLLDHDRLEGGGGGGGGSMSRLNGRVTHPGSAGHNTANAHYQGVPPQYPGQQQQMQHGSLPYPQHNQHMGHHDEFEPSCLVRTPSGNVYIPSDVPKTSTLEYKHGLHSPSLHSPVKGDHKAMEGYQVQFGSGIPVPVLPVRNNVRRSGGRGAGGGGPGSRGVPPMASKPPRCSWRCTAIVFISITVVLAACLIYVAATSMLTWPAYGGCVIQNQDPIAVPDDQQLQHHANSREHAHRPYKTIPPDGTSFHPMNLSQHLGQEILPYGYWNMQFYQKESAYVKFDISIPRGSSIGIYGRRNALPTHTSYDFLKVLNGYKISGSRSTRSSMAPLQPQKLTRYLEQGHWFLSLYNDDGDPREVTIFGEISTDDTLGCPKGCSGNGECILGACQCNPGFTGPDCTQMKCPVLCSNNGEYRDGECVCRPGWKGRECAIRHDECEVPDCNGHGHCQDGKCRCAKGFKGEFCEEVDCPHPTCSGHGWCVTGSCVCQKGWRGGDCADMDDAALQCLPDCSGHGHFDLESHQCVCDPEWTGSECSKRVCDLDCGTHGQCEGGACLCDDAWTGPKCASIKCDARCEEHGQCKNGTCICMTGWNGRHCTLAGCPGSCSGHGSCIMEEEEWTCKCHDGWEAHDCSVLREMSCSDGIDNDNDGLVDCADAECCSTSDCQQSTLCLTSVEPIDILLRKQPPAVTASFFQRMRFIVEEGSVQIYAKGAAFNESMHRIIINESRASVVRGRVISGRGTGLVGVRVSHYRPADTGFTLTRHDGWFDLMVNGGGAVRLLFGKSPFLPVTETVWVPWNEVVVIDTVVMTTHEVVPPPPPSTCPDHNYDALKPVVLATWKHGFQGGCPDQSAILTESQVVQESLAIPGSGLHLVYHSSRAPGYESTIQLQLTPSEIPEMLRRIYLRITIEGILFEKTFEADPDIKFTYAWNRLNVYRQRVYGVTWALVKVGYAYANCDQIIWDSQTTQVSGHDMSISDIGGWDLSIHHRYNFHEGILQKGDGRNVHIKQKPRVMRTLMGDGHQREVNCRSCDGPAEHQRLLTPAALAPGPDGSLYIADFNLIRRVMPDDTVRTVVQLNETRVSYRYHIAVSPVTGEVYISDHEDHLILKVRDPDDFSRPEENYMTYVGSGERCLPGDEVGCGDGSLARDAKLQYPKGMAVSLNDILYFADGTNVRAVDADGIITTVIGTHRHRSHWKPLPCEGTVPVSEVSLRWPTALAVSPLDDSLYVLDDHHVLRLTRDGQIKVVAGRPLHCPPLAHDARTDMAQHTTLRSPQSLAFAPNGDLYIAESDNERINRVRMIGTDERIHDFAGADSKCNCQEETCQCFDDSHVLAATAIFSTISALAVTPDGVLHVLDQGNLRLRSVTSSLPQPTSSNRLYEIYFPETQEMYIFDRFGHHIETRNIPTGRTIYKFAYNVNTSNGKLASVTDAAGNRVSFLRDYTGQVSMIENSKQQKCRLRVSRMRKLEEIITPDEHNVSLTYHGATGLLRSRMDSTGRAYVYTYDKYGRLIRAVTPSGQVVDLTFDLSVEGARVTITHDGTAAKTMLIKGALVTETIGAAPFVTAQLADGSVVTRTGWGHHIATETVPYSLLKDHTVASSFPVAGRQRTEIGDELVNSFDWKYFNERPDRLSDVTQVGRKMRVNGEDLLTFKYDIHTGTEAVLNKAGSTLLNVTYDALGRPLRWSPGQPFLPVQLTYKRFGQLEQWVWGDMKETFTYDRAGRFEGIEYADGGKVTYFFKDMSSVKPYKVSVLSGAEHLLEHDEGGALSAITTPRGHKYVFHIQPSLLHNRFTFTPPGYPRHPYQLFYTDDGKILAEVYPHEACRLVYHYDTDGRLQSMLFGEGSVEFGYQPETGLVRSVAVRDKAFELRIDNKYHAGLVKEQKLRFGTSSGLDPAKLRFLYDGNARPRRVELEINGKEQPDYDMKYDMILGTLESIQDLKVTTSYHNKTVVQDIRKTMLRVNNYDPHGRLIESSLTLRGRLALRLRYSYDVRGRIATITSWRGPRSEEHQSNYTYTPDGFLQGLEGSESWQFRYDANGNMISVVEGGREMTATYDTADRLVGWGDVELNTYSSAGGVVRQGEIHFSYSARGNIRSAWMRGHYRVWYRYDHNGRLSVWEDDRGNVTQYFYADLKRPNLPTHIHYPKRGVTHAMFYDEKGHLLALDTESGRYWVATDHYGTPIAVFDDSGSMVKEMVRSPWGALIKDTRPDFYIHVDFQGGLRDPATGLLIYGLHSYDPVHAQWMSPRYDKVTKAVDDVSAVYVHRFRNNDPVTPPKAKNPHYTDLDSWLKLYGVDLSLMLGSKYHDETVELPKGHLKASQLAPTLNVISGLSCSTGGVLQHFSEPSLMPQSLVQSSAPAWTMPTWSVLGHFSSSPPVLGPGVVVSRVQDRALVTLVPSRENSVVQDVARDVLNGSALLDVTMTHHHHHTLYLVKEDPASRHDDLQNLQRLSGLFNVTSKEDGEHPEVRVVGTDVSLIIQYGTDSDSARKHLLRHAHHRAVERAWELERRLAERGAPTTHPWSVEEREELISSGKVSGFLAADLHNIHRYPLLADDPTNVVFRRDTARRRRRSRRASHS